MNLIYEKRTTLSMIQLFAEYFLPLLGGALSEMYQQGKITIWQFYRRLLKFSTLTLLVMVLSTEFVSPGYFLSDLWRSIGVIVIFVIVIPAGGALMVWYLAKAFSKKDQSH